ncbi:MAG: hypothetical protein Q9205_005861 [Flavoplaca limonia]
MDPSTAAAIAAVAIAVLAFVVAIAQVLQQYFMTGSLLRLCDSVVYGPLPGRGRRVWQSGQFRFRVIYTLPQLRLEKSLWDGDDDDDVHLHEYPYIEEWSDRKFSPRSSIGHRCPSDLPNVPMQVSLRDIVILGLQTGMEVTSPYIDIETGKFSMVGRAGSITCSKHPILGSLLHFAPSGFNAGHGSLVNRDQRQINKLWVLRVKNCVPIAGRAYDMRERAHLDRLDGGWLPAAPQLEGFDPDERRNRRGVQIYTQDDDDDRKTTHPASKRTRSKSRRSKKDQPGKSTSRRRSTSSSISSSSLSSPSSSKSIYTRKSQDVDCLDVDTTHDVLGRALPVDEPPNPVSQPTTDPLTEVDDDISSHHASELDDSLAHGDEGVLFEATGITPESGSKSNGNRQHETDSTQAGDSVNMVYLGSGHASKENIELAIVESPETSRFNATKPNKNPEKRGQRESLPSTSSCEATTTPPVLTRDREKVSNEGHDRRDPGHILDDDTDAEGPNFKRDAQHEEPTQPLLREQGRTYDPPYIEYGQPYDYRGRPIGHAEAHWKWFSQMDIVHGYWATPWQSPYSMKGAFSAILEALSTRLNKRNLQYICPSGEVEEVLEWASGGRSTWPMYAINARGGVIVQEDKTKFKFPGFASKIAAVKLLHDHRWQVERYMELTQNDKKLAELMMLDSWLSICGREPEILDGASDLRRNMPLLIQFIFEQFGTRFEDLDRTTNEARSLLATFDAERLSAAEQIFTIVAMLRTAKVGSCIASGPKTLAIADVLATDTRVWLV